MTEPTERTIEVPYADGLILGYFVDWFDLSDQFGHAIMAAAYVALSLAERHPDQAATLLEVLRRTAEAPPPEGIDHIAEHIALDGVCPDHAPKH